MKLVSVSILFLGCGILCSSHSDDGKPDTIILDLSHEYCIVGAGPAGLQMGYYFEKAKRDYVIFEQNNVTGSFFQLYPRHRKLISINKRYTGRTNREFNLRHDWNSLLTEDFSLLFANYSKEYFPHADSLLKYLKDYGEKFHLKIQYNTKISQIAYHHENMPNNLCRFTMRDQNNEFICCKSLLIATGLSVAIHPEIAQGQEYIEYYDTIPVNPENYEGQSVLIMGRGNSGFELANSIYGGTNFVHMMARGRLKLSWETHYVGDIRGLNNEIIDSYMLKSLDGFFEANLSKLQITKRTDGSGKLDVSPQTINSWSDTFKERSPTREGYDRIISCIGFRWDNTIFKNTMPIKPAKLKVKSYTEPIGQRMYTEVESDKYPEIHHDYQSKQYPGLYFIGTLTHSLDYRKSAGGFIHGFRYTIRALHRILEYRNHGIPWPTKKRSIDQLVISILNRANEASGIYQMFGHLCDIAILDVIGNTFIYLEEVPANLLPNILHNTGHDIKADRHKLLILTLEYGKNFSEPGADHFDRTRAQVSQPAELNNFLHPVVYFYNGRVPNDASFAGKAPEDFLPGSDSVHHVYEDFTTSFDGPTAHIKPLREFIEKCLDRDLKTYLADDCVATSLTTNIELPASCNKFLESEESILWNNDI